MTIPEDIILNTDLSHKPPGMKTLDWLTDRTDKAHARNAGRVAEKQFLSIKAKFKSMKPGPERTAFYNKHHNILKP